MEIWSPQTFLNKRLALEWTLWPLGELQVSASALIPAHKTPSPGTGKNRIQNRRVTNPFFQPKPKGLSYHLSRRQKRLPPSAEFLSL